MKYLIPIGLFIMALQFDCLAQADTVYGFASKKLDARIKEGTSQYLIFFQNKKKAKRAGAFLSTQTVKFKTINGIEAIAIEQKAYSSDTSAYFYEYSLVRRDNFNPIHFRMWSQRSGVLAYDFYPDKVVASDTVASNAKKGLIATTKKLMLNWNIDLLTFPLLKLKNGKSYFMNFYQPGSPKDAQLYEYKVTGSETIKGSDGEQIDCWKLSIVYSEINKATFYISKKTNEVLKLEEDFGSGVRYKVRLPGDLLIR
ncbi:MAG: hypothetical protein ACKODM_14945 [Cytophagales bacterium]